MRVDWCVTSWFRIKNTHSHALFRRSCRSGAKNKVLALFHVPPCRAHLSLSVVRGVNRAIRSHLATLSARLARA